jgi:hypothetical protein
MLPWQHECMIVPTSNKVGISIFIRGQWDSSALTRVGVEQFEDLIQKNE